MSGQANASAGGVLLGLTAAATSGALVGGAIVLVVVSL
jgi:hypothetical protein